MAIQNPFFDIEITEDYGPCILPELDEGYFLLNGIVVDGKIELCRGDVFIYKRSAPPKGFSKRKLFWPIQNKTDNFEN